MNTSMGVFDRSAFARAVQKMFTATSSALSRDCYTHAAIIQAALESLGVHAELRVGYAAWRTEGTQPHAVIAHHPEGVVLDPNPKHHIYHAWLQINQDVVDFTTYQLPLKAAALDALDGFTTPVEWAPLYLWEPISNVRTYVEVRDGHVAGLFHYSPQPELEKMLSREACEVDHGDVQTLRAVYELELRGEGLIVVGPNTTSRELPT